MRFKPNRSVKGDHYVNVENSKYISVGVIFFVGKYGGSPVKREALSTRIDIYRNSWRNCIITRGTGGSGGGEDF